MESSEWLLIIVIILVGIVIGINFGGFIATKEHRTSVIEHGCAYYHPQTSEFTWIEK